MKQGYSSIYSRIQPSVGRQGQLGLSEAEKVGSKEEGEEKDEGEWESLA